MAGSDPVTIAELDLERVAVGAWVPDEVELRHGWMVRAAEGFTGRGNSALVLADPDDRLSDVLDDVVGWYRDRGLTPLVAVPLPVLAAVRDRLEARGWRTDHGGRVLVRGLGGLDGRPGRAGLTISDALTDDWTGRYQYRGQALPPAGRRMLERGGTVGLAAIHDGDEVVAIGRGVVIDGGESGRWLGVNAVETAPSHRRRGLASDVLAGLAAWARGHGADRVFLQVDLANDVARTVYLRAGFVEHHTYAYLHPPTGT